MQLLGLEIDLISEESIFGMQAQDVAKWVIMTYMHTQGKAGDVTRVLTHARREIIPTLFYMYLGAKYMTVPKFRKIPKMYNPLGILSWDPMASI